MTTDRTLDPSRESDSPTAQVVSPAMRKKLQQCYEHGTKLMQQEKYDFGYAHSSLLECVLHDPGNLMYVEAFLQNLQRKYNNNRRGALLAFGGKGAFKKALSKKEWGAVFKLGPEVLKSNPWDVATLRGLAEACAACGYGDVELRYLRNALDANPKDPAVNRHCAQSLARIGAYDQAIACWTRVDEAKRGDVEAQRMISELQMDKTKAHHGTGKGGGSHKVSRQATSPRDEETPDAPPRREFKQTPRQRLEQTIANSPADIDAYLELAQLHIGEDRLGDAAHVLTKALAASGNQPHIQERIEDVEILRKRQQLAVAEKRAGGDGGESDQELARRLREDLNHIELEVFDRRAQRYPNDLELKFQLGMRLKRAGKTREALASFEEARRLPERRASAMLEIGECLQRQRHYEKALQYYWMAAEEPSAEKIELRKLALYRIGVLAEGLRNVDDAERGLNELIEIDPHYRDAASRLDRIRQMRHKQA